MLYTTDTLLPIQRTELPSPYDFLFSETKKDPCGENDS